MGRFDSLTEDITNMALPICARIGIELVDVKINSYNNDLIIQVFADRPQGGIGMEECAKLNRELAAQLDASLSISDNYALEVSSPGLDRKLVGAKDFRRVLGREVQVFLKEAFDGKREYSGLLKAVGENEIIVETKKKEVVLSMHIIDKGKQIIN